MVVIKFILLISLLAPCILVECTRNCSAPNGLGLRNLFHQIENILPSDQISQIITLYGNDSEVIALRAYNRRAATLEKLRIIRASEEYQRLNYYACQVLHVTLQELNKWALTQMNTSTTSAGTEQQTGIRGFINAVNAVIPHQEIRSLYRNLTASDEELVNAVENLNSEEFRQLMLNVKNNVPAFRQLSTELKDLGVPLDEMRELVAKYYVGLLRTRT